MCCQSTWLRPLYSNCKKKTARGKNIIMGSIKPLVFSLHTRSLCAYITFLQVRQASRNELKSKRCLPARATCGGEFIKAACARAHFCQAPRGLETHAHVRGHGRSSHRLIKMTHFSYSTRTHAHERTLAWSNLKYKKENKQTKMMLTKNP